MRSNKERIKESFSRSAPNYDRHAAIQERMAQKLLTAVSGDFKSIVDVGCGTGTLVGLLASRYPRAKVAGLDLAPGMIRAARAKIKNRNVEFMVGDGEDLPFGPASFDLVISCAALQWMDPAKAFVQAAKVLKPNGVFCFATFGPKTMIELRQAGLAVNDFPTQQDLTAKLAEWFDPVEWGAEINYQFYGKIGDFFAYLKAIGARVPGGSQRRGLQTKGKLLSAFAAQEGLTVTFELLFAAGIKT